MVRPEQPLSAPPQTVEQLRAQVEELRLRLQEAEETIHAVRTGAVDAFVVEEPGGQRVFTLAGADRPYRLFVEEMQQGAATLHADGTIAWCNSRLAELLKEPYEKLLGSNLGDYFSPESRPIYDNLLWQGRNRTGRGEAHLQRSDGAPVPAYLTFSALSEDCGTAMGVLITDLTSQRHHEQLTAAHHAARESEERLRLAHQVARMGTFEWNVQTGVVAWDADLEAMYGLPRGGFPGTQPAWEQLIHPEDREEAVRRVRQSMETSTFDGEWRVIWADGSVHWIAGRATVFRDEEGQPIKLFGVNMDITERKQREEALRTAQTLLQQHASELEARVAERTADLQATNEQLETFVYSIAHDLREPLRSMEGFSAMLLKEAAPILSEECQDYASRINRSAQFMDALLTDLLAFSQISQQRIELKPVSLDMVLQGVLLLLEKEIQEKQARIELAGSWPYVLGHAPTLGQVIFNLINNALKFTAPGVVPTVRVRAEELPAEAFALPAARPRNGQLPAPGPWVRVSVQDNGVGIAPEHHEQVFRIFTRLHGKMFAGTGIGLAIVQKAIERMSGRLGLESAPGQGSRFWFCLRKA